MKSISISTVALAALVVLVAGGIGWKIMKDREEKALRAREDAAMDKTLRDLGYIEDDTLATTSYADNTSAAPAGQYKDGSAEKPTQYQTPAKTQQPSATTTPKSGIETTDAADAPKPVTSSVPSKKPSAQALTSSAPKKSAPATSAKKTAKSPSGGRYWVVAGAFEVMDGARDEMEKLVKLGFTDAAALKEKKGGRYGYAVAKQTNSQTEAEKVLERIRAKGYKDAYIKKMW